MDSALGKKGEQEKCSVKLDQGRQGRKQGEKEVVMGLMCLP